MKGKRNVAIVSRSEKGMNRGQISAIQTTMGQQNMCFTQMARMKLLLIFNILLLRVS